MNTNKFELRLLKYEHPELKEKLYQSNNIFEANTVLSPAEKIILIFENMLENALFLQTLYPEEKIEVAEKLFQQAKDYYANFVKPFFKEYQEIQDFEKKKIEKLEEFMQTFEVNLDDESDKKENKDH